MDSNEIFAGGTAAAVIAHLLSVARNRGLIATIDQHRAWAALASLLTSLGIAFQFDAATGQWALSGTLWGLVVGLWHATVQYGFVDMAYKQWARITLAKVFDQSGCSR